MSDLRCALCRTEFDSGEIKGANACPNCDTTSTPMSVQDDVTIAINWHELRILGIWASNWGSRDGFPRSGRESLAAILLALELQHPNKTPLTLSGEMQELRQAIADGEIPATGMETNVRDLLDGGAA